MSQYNVLAARIKNELNILERVVASANAQVSKAQATGDADFYQAAALSLQNYYMGIERIFEEVAKQLDQALPSGRSSHRELLTQMGLEIPNARPALLSPETVEQINEFRAFRHVVIHRYGFELQPERVGVLAGQLQDSHAALTHDVLAFCRFLLTLDQDL